jgi:hypothetical protein
MYLQQRRRMPVKWVAPASDDAGEIARRGEGGDSLVAVRAGDGLERRVRRVAMREEEVS